MINFFFTIAFIFSISTNALAGYQHNSILGGRDYCLDVSNESGTVINNQCKPIRVPDGSLTDRTTFFLLRTGASNGASVSMASNDTTVDTSYSYVRKAISSDPAFQAGTLPDGQAGKLIIIEITELQAPGATWTLTPTSATGWSSIVFSAARQRVALLFIDEDYGWVIISNQDATVNYI